MGLKKLIKPYKEKKDSGLLSVKVEGSEHLVKIYFELGMIAGLSIGTLKNEDCFNILCDCRPMEASFIKGYKTPDFVSADKATINDKFEQLLSSSYPVTGASLSAEERPQRVVSAESLLKLEEDFINVIGPIGRMIIDTAYIDLGYSRGKDMPSSLYSRFIERLRGELPDQHQRTFAVKYAIGLALEND
jgi:hypothetical protein